MVREAEGGKTAGETCLYAPAEGDTQPISVLGTETDIGL